jgi:hypothetical protein
MGEARVMTTDLHVRGLLFFVGTPGYLDSFVRDLVFGGYGYLDRRRLLFLRAACA